MATLNSNALVTLDYLKELLEESGTAKDNLYTILINAASARIEAYIGYDLNAQDYTDQELSGSGSNSIVLPQFPINSFTRLQFGSGRGSEKDWDTVESSLYDVELSTGIITVDGKFYTGRQRYRASYNAGYFLIPDDVQYATVILVEQLKGNRKLNMLIKSEKLRDYSVTYKNSVGFIGAISDDLKAILDNYKSRKI